MFDVLDLHILRELEAGFSVSSYGNGEKRGKLRG